MREWNQWEERRPEFLEPAGGSKHLLGDEDAGTEWNGPNKLGPVNLFVHTRSYDEFKSTECTCVFGRRGTGKSALMRMLRHEIRDPDNFPDSPYRFCWLLDGDESYKSMSTLCRSIATPFSIPEDELRYFFSKVWSWIIGTSAMIGCIHADPQRLPITCEYLDSIGQLQIRKRLSPRRETVARFACSVLEKQLEARCDTRALNGTLVELNSISFKEAWNELREFLDSEGTCLVMIDSIDEYNVKDPISRSSLSGLLKAVHETYADNPRVRVKAAVPSELYPHVTDWHSGKSASHHLFVMWTFKDLVCFLSKRLLRMIRDGGIVPSGQLDWSFDDLSTYEKARGFAYLFFPPKIETRHGLESDTLAYIIKHTQKRPRQLLIVANEIATRCLNGGSLRVLSSKEIRDGVHRVSGALAADALENYQIIYHNAPALARQMFVRKRNVFRFSEFDKLAKDITRLRRSNNLTVLDCERLFIEAGIMGRVRRSRETDHVRFLEVEFEYQVKGTIGFNSEDLVAIHPMFYDAYGTLVERGTAIFPTPSDEEEKLIVRGVIESEAEFEH